MTATFSEVSVTASDTRFRNMAAGSDGSLYTTTPTKVFRTTDGFGTLVDVSPKVPLGEEEYFGISVAPSGAVFVTLLNGGVYKSINSGASWTLVCGAVHGWRSIHAISDSVWLVGTAAAGVVRTLDGGSSFATVLAGIKSAQSFTVEGNGTVSMAVLGTINDTPSLEGRVYTTADQGGTWAVKYSAPGILISGAVCDPYSGTYYLGIYDGTTKATLDFVTFTEAFPDPLHGGAIRSDRAYLCSYAEQSIAESSLLFGPCKHFACFNGALRGTSTIEAPAPWGVISTVYNNCVIRMGNVLVALEQYTGTEILLSLDSGLTWNVQTVPDREGRQLSSAARIGNLICIAGEGGMVLVSTDAGITWTGYGDGSPSYVYFRDMVAVGPYFVALDINRGVMRSTDGAVWTLANALSVGAYSAQICTDGTTLVIANDKVWHSIDQGVTWVEVPGSSEASGWTVARGWDGFHTEAAAMRGFSADGVSWTFEASTGDIKRTAPGMQSSGPLYVATRWSAGGLAVSSGDGAWTELFAGGSFPSFHQNSLALEYLTQPTKTWVGQAGSWKLADVSVGAGGAWKPSQVSVGTAGAWL